MDYVLISENDVVDDFTKNVSDYLDEDTRIYFITNTSDNGEIEFYNSTNSLNDLYFNTNEIIATVENTNYTFPLTKGKHFYFIMIKEFKDEKYVYTNA